MLVLAAFGFAGAAIVAIIQWLIVAALALAGITIVMAAFVCAIPPLREIALDAYDDWRDGRPARRLGNRDR